MEFTHRRTYVKIDIIDEKKDNYFPIEEGKMQLPKHRTMGKDFFNYGFNNGSRNITSIWFGEDDLAQINGIMTTDGYNDVLCEL